MTALTAPQATSGSEGTSRPPASSAGPVEPSEPLRLPPEDPQAGWVQTIRFSTRPLAFNLRAHQRYGDVWQLRLISRPEPFVVTCHPDHVRSLMKARPADAPSLTGESPLRPILGPNSVLTSIGDRHMRQRRLLLPPFHGEAVQRYVEMISAVAEREIDRWPLNETFALAPRMQAVTLDVIMSGVFGIEGRPARGSTGDRLRRIVRRLLGFSTTPLFALVELKNAKRQEPRGVMGQMLAMVDRQLFAMISERRAEGDASGRNDVLSLLIAARDDEGQPLTDQELRDELMALVLAGHETTANSLAWIFERLVRNPAAYTRLRDLVRAGGEDGDAYVEATIHEGMRNRPVIPMVVRMVKRPWRFGEYVVPARTPVAVSIVALHHRADLYPNPLAFRPERFLGARDSDGSGLAFSKPGTYAWMPFGGGIRRCLGASLAMAEQRVVLEAIARRTDLIAPHPAPERARQRNVTTIPNHGARVAVTARYPA